MGGATIVVPCYNEAKRLDGEGYRTFLSEPSIELLFVDDGSTDDTSEVLQAICERLEGRARRMRLSRNSGKSEAVRVGMRSGLERGAAVVGYFDADLATPPREMIRLFELLE